MHWTKAEVNARLCSGRANPSLRVHSHRPGGTRGLLGRAKYRRSDRVLIPEGTLDEEQRSARRSQQRMRKEWD